MKDFEDVLAERRKLDKENLQRIEEYLGWDRIARHTNEILNEALQGIKLNSPPSDWEEFKFHARYLKIAHACLKLLNDMRVGP